jgi:hypothetical protein
MPSPVIGGLISFLTQQLNVICWDGEVPRFDTGGQPINPDQLTTNPPSWPVIKLYMQEGGFERTWTTEDPYCDSGEILIRIWGTTRVQVENLMNQIEALFAQATNWQQINLGNQQSVNPPYVIQMLLRRWYSGQEEEQRLAQTINGVIISALCYRGDMYYFTELHGAISTA